MNLRPIERFILRRLGKRDVVRAVAVITAACWLLGSVSLALAARPGGGSSYSGGSSKSSGGGSSSGGGGSSGDGEALFWVIMLCIEHPTLGVPLLIVFVVVAVVRSRGKKALAGNEWVSGLASGYPGAAAFQREIVNEAPALYRKELARLQHTDPGFSIVVFEDFVYFLYAEMHRARGAGQTGALAAYIGDQAQATLRNDGRVAEVTGIIIGSLTYADVTVEPDGAAEVAIVVESNYVERYRPQGEQRFFAKEKIVLTRAAGARSRTPDKARTLNCPNCGGPLQGMRGRTCSYCNTVVEMGARDWGIETIQLLEREPRGPLLTSSVDEQGTSLPTIHDPHAQATFARIRAKDPELTWPKVEARIATIFQEFHAGWVARDPSKVRPFVSDNFFQSQLYWIDLYRANRCVNRTDGARITRLEFVAATTDAYYDSVTVRLYGTGLDFTISEDGKVLSGSTTKPRAYSEYWTLIRGAQKKRTDKGDKQCPNCGAPLAINMTGNCQYCGVKVTSGEYDWVLSRIEQDEAYSG